MLPNFLIIGAQKSASTFVHECLREHPEIFMPPKETPFFENPFYNLMDIGEIEALFDHVEDSSIRAAGIRRPDYLGREECPARIHAHLPQARLIAILREPIARTVSAYYWYMRQGYIPLRPLNDGLYHILTGEYRERYPRSHEIVDYGLYHTHLTRYLSYFDRSQILIMLHDDFERSAAHAIREVYAFLQVDTGHVPRALHSIPLRSVYSLTRVRLLRIRNPLVHRYLVYGDNGKVAVPRQGVLPMLAKIAFYLTDKAITPWCNNDRPPLNDELRVALWDVFAEDVENLERLIGRDLSKWK